MVEYEVRFRVDEKIEQNIKTLIANAKLEKIKDYEFIDWYFKKGREIVRIREWLLPKEKVEIIRTNYSFSKEGKKGDKIKIPVSSFEEGKKMLKDYKPFLGIKKLNGEHFRVGDNVRIALEDVYIIKEGKEQYFGRLGEVEIEGEEGIEEMLDKTLKKFGIEDYLGKSLLEIVEDEGSFFGNRGSF